MAYPQIIQGGMGVAVSSWALARAVSRCGELGVVSGTGLDGVLPRRLQLGDPGGHMRRALDAFPVRDMAERVWERYFTPGGKPADRPFKSKPLPSADLPAAWTELTVVANFVEVFLAKEGHSGVVGINLLEKIQIPTIPSLFGAMLAGVDYVLMGAGIPRAIPAVLDHLAEMKPTELRLDVAGAAPGEEFATHFDPKAFVGGIIERLSRPKFLAIISSATLAVTLARKSTGRVDGFVVEGSTAGGHNAPPRGGVKLDETGQPIYGPRDTPDLAAIREVGLPFWLAGSYAEPERLQEAIAAGAEGIQVGTAFAFCEESGIDPDVKRRVIEKALAGQASVFTDPSASPTGFPFKVLGLEESASEPEVVATRERICDLGYLRSTYRREDGTLGYRCPAEPIDDYLRKGGELSETVGRKCVCNGLFSTIGLGQVRKNQYHEPTLVTAGDEVSRLARFVPPGEKSYHAEDVLAYLRGERKAVETVALASEAGIS
jgi:NAD(P)H-dependent flavin oxidoreductase YrpB (nitropropane dioxygenase family)